MRKLSKKKDAPKELKKKIEKLKKLEEKLINFKKENNSFINSQQGDITVQQILTKVRIQRNKKWQLRRKINKIKTYIGLSNPIINIIIPRKVEV